MAKASLDRFEGDAIEGGVLLVLAIILAVLVAVFYFAKGFKLPSLPDFGPMIENAVKQIEDWIKNAFHGPALDAFDRNANPYSGKSGPDWVITGTSGMGDVTETTSNGSGLDEYQFSDAELQGSMTPLQLLDLPGTPIDPYAGLPPVQLPQAWQGEG